MTTDDAVAFARLDGALAAVGDALSRADLDRLLATEPVLSAAMEAVARLRPGGVDTDRRAAIDRVRTSLLRCRRLGAALVEFTRISLDPSGDGVYSRMGSAIDRTGAASAVVLGPTLEARG